MMNYHNGAFEDDALDDNGVIRDGQTLRVPIFMIDGTDVKIPPLTHQDQTIGEKVMAMRESDETGQQKYLTWLNNAWRDPSAPAQVSADQQTVKDATTEPATLADAYAAYHDRLTTAHLNPPSMVPIIPSNNAESLLPPPSASMTDERTKLYQSYNERISRLWENPL